MAAAMIVWLARLLLVLNKIIARMVPRLPSTLEACDELAGRLHPVLVRMRHVAYVKQVQVLQEEMLREHHLAVTAAPERVYPIGSTQKLIRAAAGLERGRGVDLTGVETGGRYGQVPADRSEFLERLSQGAGQHVRTAAMDAVIDTANLNTVQEVDSDDDSEEWPDEDDDDLLDDFDDVFTEDDYWEDQVEQLRREKADEETEKEAREELEQARRERGARRQKSMSEARGTAKTGPVLGYARVLAGEVNCAFCAMLASRGAVYKTEQTAGFEAHDNCDCGVVCVVKGKAWDGDNEAALLQELWEDARDHPTEEERSRMEGGKQLQTPAARFRSRYTRLVKTGEAARFKTDKVLAAEDTLLWMRSRRFPGSSKGRKSA